MKSLDCPNCSANLEPVNKRFFKCPYCNTTIHNEYYDGSEAAEETVTVSSKAEDLCLDKVCIENLVELGADWEFEDYDDIVFGTPIEKHKKLANARRAFEIPTEDNVYLLYDSTVFGSCKKGFAFCTSGIYFSDDGDAGTGFYTWEEFVDNEISYEDGELMIGEASFIGADDTITEFGDFLIGFHDQVFDFWYDEE